MFYRNSNNYASDKKIEIELDDIIKFIHILLDIIYRQF